MMDNPLLANACRQCAATQPKQDNLIRSQVHIMTSSPRHIGLDIGVLPGHQVREIHVKKPAQGYHGLMSQTFILVTMVLRGRRK